jgi:probable rRNA maturation factor
LGSAAAGGSETKFERAVAAALAAGGVAHGHVAVALVGPEEMRSLNRDHRGRDAPTDVLSFPVDEDDAGGGPRELGDVFVCPQHADDVIRCMVHGVLHLLGFDHETDDGEMLALEDRVVEGLPR